MIKPTKKWTQLPYVPTPVFNTPLPSKGHKGPRASRREGGGRGGHGAADKSTTSNHATSSSAKQQNASSSSASNPVENKARNEVNGSKENIAVAAVDSQSATSISDDALISPTTITTTASSTTPQSADPRKTQQQQPQHQQQSGGDHRGRGGETQGQAQGQGRFGKSSVGDDSSAGRQVNGSESFPPRHRNRSYTRNFDNTYQSKSVSHVHGGGSLPPTGHHHDRRFENAVYRRDSFTPAADSFGNHKDSSHRDFRSERGGRGGHRGGRGNYHGVPHQQFTTTTTAGLPQQQQQQQAAPTFVPQKPSYLYDRRSSHQYTQPNGSQHHRVPAVRSPSLPTTPTPFYGVHPFPPTPTADVSGMYAGYPYMPMNAVPYQQYMEPMPLMSMLSMQLEYYFSVDNLCKDLFLRKHMDSQGFVLLGFIAGFKRVKNLTEDLELLRYVARQLRNVEYLAGGDGFDRLRPRERWAQWVLPMESRDPSARTSGPPAAESLNNNNNNLGGGVDDAVFLQAFGNSYVPMNGGAAAPVTTTAAPAARGPLKSLLNGTGSSSRSSGSPLSSTAPEFSPSSTVKPQNDN